jgi:DNA-binding GntR family transcriptional regulator
MTELQALICLGILLYATEDDACPADEHRQIANAIVAGNGAAAASLMLRHLAHIEADLNLDDKRPVVRIAETLTWLGGKATTS